MKGEGITEERIRRIERVVILILEVLGEAEILRLVGEARAEAEKL